MENQEAVLNHYMSFLVTDTDDRLAHGSDFLYCSFPMMKTENQEAVLNHYMCYLVANTDDRLTLGSHFWLC